MTTVALFDVDAIDETSVSGGAVDPYATKRVPSLADVPAALAALTEDSGFGFVFIAGEGFIYDHEADDVVLFLIATFED